MNDLKFIAQIKDEPLALIVLGGVVLIKIIEYAIKFAPRFFSFLFSKEKKLPFWKWQGFVSERINEIESKIEKLFAIISTHEHLLDKTSEGTLENQLFNESLWPFLRLKAFRRLLAMGKNGRIWARGFDLIFQNKEIWLDVLDTELGIEIANPEYYNARLKEIRVRIYGDYSGK